MGLTGLKEAAATGPTASMARAASEATGGLASAAGSEERTAVSTARSESEERPAASTARSGAEERSASRSFKRKGMERGEDEAAPWAESKWSRTATTACRASRRRPTRI